MISVLYPYPFDEFLRHYDGITAGRDQSGSQPFESNVIRVFEYMRKVSGDDDESRWKMACFVPIMKYISEHIEDFDKGDFAVNGSPKVGALIGQHLMRAVHEIFTTTDLTALGYGPSPESVLELAAKYRPSHEGA